MATVNIKFTGKKVSTDPSNVPVLIIGLTENLAKAKFSDFTHALGSRVDQKVFEEAVESNAETAYLFGNKVILAKLPGNCSRHNAPSRPHSITKIVKNLTCGQSENVIVVCNEADIYASGCAVARSYSLYNKKTTSVLPGQDANLTSPVTQNEKNERVLVTVQFCPIDRDQLSEDELRCLEHAKDGIQMAARIVDTPCNFMHTDEFILNIKDVAKCLGIATPLVIQGEELARQGFGGIYGVGKAAVHEPALVVLSHTPKCATKTIAWVGKGIVYDTGGLSIKGKTAMPGMKRDCGGAAGILGAFYAAVKQGFKQNLHAIFCLAENAVGDRATRPDDIHTLYSGRTVEINNTDAEGRLVVSDGVVYANKDLKADIILDMCTLTGAQGISTGRYHAAHLTNSANWEEKTRWAGKMSGDLSFPLVYCPELHFSEFYSAIADMKNSVADRSNAQSSCAGLFINAHLGFDYPGTWVHVDMAYPVHNGERATGYGVALLNVLFGEHVESGLLNKLAGSGENGNIEDSPSKKKIKLK